MTQPTLASLDKKTLENFYTVLHELTALVAEENAILIVPTETLPQAMVDRKEALGSRYTALTQSLRRRAAAMRASGDLNPEDLEGHIRDLVRGLRENQTLLNARKAATATRVEAVMKALSDREKKDPLNYSAAGDALPRPVSRNSGLRLHA
ncbi:MAG: hypothetical protein JXQ84_03895 [Rhodospirillaceae bacterium]|nr:hypothetical protein [Rhodospirillaceae bacterium]